MCTSQEYSLWRVIESLPECVSRVHLLTSVLSMNILVSLYSSARMHWLHWEMQWNLLIDTQTLDCESGDEEEEYSCPR